MNDITKIKVDGELESTYKLFSKNREFEKRAGGGKGGSQSIVQSDWNQNDDTKPDYVKNRPFYTGDPVETVLVEESTVTFTEGSSGLYGAQFPSTFVATVGKIYKVYWDGSAYECTCAVFGRYLAIGNLSIAGAGSDTGEPFIMMVSNGNGIEIATTDTSASHTISISGFAPEVVKIDRKFLPVGVGTTVVITYVMSTNDCSFDHTYDELHEILLDHGQVVFWEPEGNRCSYLTKWEKTPDGSIKLAFAGGNYRLSLHTDGTVGYIE